MAEKNDPPELVDTVPPPASGDAYNAETVQRVVSPELLAEAKQEMLRRAARPPPKKTPAAEAQRPLFPAPLPHIERPFADEDSFSDDDQTLMRPATMDHIARAEIATGNGSAPPVGEEEETRPSVPGGGSVAHPITHALSPTRTSHPPAALGWAGSALVFLASLAVVLLVGYALLNFFVPR
jgi:hypothetical protein